jgi:mandelamide amidase
MELPGLEEALAGPRRAIAMYECLPNLARYLADTGIELEDLISGTRTTGLLEHLRGIQGEKRIAEVDYRKAVEEQRPALQGLLREAFKIHRIAALVLPATLVPPGKRDAEITIERKGETLGRFAAEGHNTGLSSSAGIPTVTVPAGLTEDGLPVGLAFDGPEGGDRDLLALALAYERSRPPPPAPVMLGGE